jgi:trimeric autotransporter adhesin
MVSIIQLTLSCLLCTSLAITALSADSDLYYISTVAGREFSKGKNQDGILAVLAELDDPVSIALDASGNQYITEITGGRIRKVDAITGLISTVAGVGKNGGSSADNIAAVTADLSGPTYMILDPEGNIYYSESLDNRRVRKISATTGIVTTVAGSERGYDGNNGPATKAKLDSPCGLALDKTGNLYIADSGNDVIRRVDAITDIITTYAGTGARRFYGENVPAIEAKIAVPVGLAFDASWNLIIADTGNSCIRKVDGITGYIKTLAGDCDKSGFKGDGYDALNATFSSPTAISYDASGNLYIVDYGNRSGRIRRVSATSNIIRTVAGSGDDYYNGDGILALTAGMTPSGVTPDKNGNFYVVDRGNDIVRYVSLSAPTSSPTYGVTSSPKPTYV